MHQSFFRSIRRGMSCLLLLALFSSSAFAVQEGLRQELEITETEEFIFGGISGIKVDDSGGIFVRDSRQFHIKMFDAEGTFLQTLGREGQGPGEFQELTSFDLGEGELVVLDDKSHRISYFDLPTGQHSEAFTYRREQTESGIGHPEQIFYLSRNRVAVVNTMPASTANADKDRWEFLTIFSRKGEVLESQVVRKPEDEMLVRKPSATSVQVADRPLGRKSIYRKDSEGKVWYGWTDRLKLEQYGAAGTLVNVIETNLDNVPVEDGYYGRMSEFVADMAAFHSQYGATPHETWPVVEDFLTGGEGTVWVHIRTDTPDNLHWTTFNWKGGFEFDQTPVFRVPSGDRVLAIQNNKVYSAGSTEDGASFIRRYAIVRE